MLNPRIELIAREFKQALQTIYGDRLHDVILYGSYARGDYDEESDIDLMVLLTDETVDTITEIFKITEIETDITLKYGYPISPLPVAYHRYQTSVMPVYQEARREGLLV